MGGTGKNSAGVNSEVLRDGCEEEGQGVLGLQQEPVMPPQCQVPSVRVEVRSPFLILNYPNLLSDFEKIKL